MIHTRQSRGPDNQIQELHISVTLPSIPVFKQLLARALNTWDNAPAELKELGDIVEVGYPLQDYRGMEPSMLFPPDNYEG